MNLISSEAMTNHNQGFISSITNNIWEILPMGYYTILGLSTQKDINFVGKNTLPVIGSYFLTNTIDRFPEIRKVITDPAELIHHHHEIIADNIINSSAAIAGALLGLYTPDYALLSVGIFLGTQMISMGDGSPIEYFKSGVTATIDYICPYI